MEELLNYAKRVCFKISKDPEMESIAGVDTLLTVRAFAKRIPMEPQAAELYAVECLKGPMRPWFSMCIARCAKCYLRRKARLREVHMETWWFEETISIPVNNDDEDSSVSALKIALHSMHADDVQLLREKHVERYNQTAMARKRGITVSRLREMVKAAEARLRCATG